MKKAVKVLLFILVACVIVNMNTSKVWCEEVTDYGILYSQWETEKMIEHMDKAFDEYIKSHYGEKNTGNANQDTQTSTAQGTNKKEEKPKKTTCDHEYDSEVTKEATCAEEGLLTYTCNKCNNTYTEAIPKSEDHTYTSTITKESSCTETGIMTYVCDICGDTYTEDIPVVEHDYVTEVIKKANCTEAGEEKTYCSKCVDSSTKEVPALGHTESEWQIVTPNGMFSEGLQIKVCTTCQEQLEKQVINSKYPIMYLYIGIGAAVIVVILLIFIIFKRR